MQVSRGYKHAKLWLPIVAVMILALGFAKSGWAQPWPGTNNNAPQGPWPTPQPPAGNGNQAQQGPWPTPQPPAGNGNQAQQGPWTAPQTPADNGNQSNNATWAAGGTTIINVTNDVKMPSAKRVGVNIGAYDQYGSAQYMRNLIPNPGFESAEFSMLFLAAPGAAPNRVQPNRWNGLWNAHPSGFWTGAQYEIVSGAGRGTVGRVERYALENGLFTFYLAGNGNPINERDVIIVRQQIAGYYTETPTRFHVVEPNDRRPGSPGQQSLRLMQSGFQPALAVPFDSFARDADPSAGKLNIVDGLWQFSIWLKPTAPGQSVEIKFLRHREAVFYQETIPLQPGWQKIERKFFVPPGTDAPIPNDINPLAFEVRIAAGPGELLIDDAEISRAENRYQTAFSDRFIDLLRELRPGVLRNWGHQLGTSLDNQLAEPWARKTNDYDPNDSNPVKFHYSLHEFLELSRAVGAEPWYVVPPTWSPAELQNLIAYLSAPAGSHPYAAKRAALGQAAPWTDVFPQIHLEFGNEMWGGNTAGDPFRGATVWDGYHLGEIVGQRLSIMRASPYFRAGKIDLIIGGQAGFAERQMEIMSTSSSHDSIGVAPYYFNNPTTFGSNDLLFYPLFANPTAMVAADGKMRRSLGYVKANGRNVELAIYEISTHLTHGNMPLASRNDLITSLGMGLAMPLHMLTYQAELGIRNQAAFTALQYSWEVPRRGGERAKLWGLLRDTEASGVKRPAWLGMEMANRAIRGDFLQVSQSGANPTWTQQPVNGIEKVTTVPYVQSFAFRAGNSYSVVVFNLSLYEQQTVQINMPAGVGNATIHTLTAPNIMDDNEGAINVRIATRSQFLGQNGSLTLAPHSMTVIDFGP